MCGRRSWRCGLRGRACRTGRRPRAGAPPSPAGPAAGRRRRAARPARPRGPAGACRPMSAVAVDVARLPVRRGLVARGRRPGWSARSGPLQHLLGAVGRDARHDVEEGLADQPRPCAAGKGLPPAALAPPWIASMSSAMASATLEPHTSLACMLPSIHTAGPPRSGWRPMVSSGMSRPSALRPRSPGGPGPGAARPRRRAGGELGVVEVLLAEHRGEALESLLIPWPVTLPYESPLEELPGDWGEKDRAQAH
jgi:hypothetical protein